MRRTHFNAALIAAMAALLMLTACGGNKEADSTPPPALRTPIPTFTPTASTIESASASSESPSSNEAAANTDTAASPDDTSSARESQPAAIQQTAPASVGSAPGVGGPMEPPVVVAPVQPALGVINTQLVNSRSGPDTTFDVVMILGAGENYDITGKNADASWVRICCVEQQEAWAKTEFIDVTGSLDNLPVAQAGETSGQTVTRSAAAAQSTVAASAPAASAAAASEAPASEAAAAAPAASQPVEQAAAAAPEAEVAANAPAEAAGALQAGTAEAGTAEAITAEAAAAAEASPGALQLASQEQFPETNVLRVFLFAYQGTEALEGYSVRVVKDGVEQSASGISFGGRPGMTWPIADERQRFQNLKVEFPGVTPAGTWEVTVMKDGAAAGPTATFTLADGDTSQELYVRYAMP